MSSPTFLQRARARNPLPAGTLAVGAGFLVAGLTIYVFLAVAARALGPERYAGLSAMWAITFLAAPGFYFPVEQEIGRALSDRRARGLGGAPVVRRAAIIVLAFVVFLGLMAIATSGVLLDTFFDDQVLLLVGFLTALVAYAIEHLTRGTLSGNGRFPTYALVVGSEGVIRMAGSIALAAAGVATAGPYGLVVGLAPLLAVAVVVPKERGLLTPGPQVQWSELSRAFSYLLVGSVLAMAMLNLAPLIVNVLAGPGERELVGKVLIALIVARIPVFMFQAVQASLIPQLARLAAQGAWDEFHSRLLRLLGAVTAVGVVATVAAGTLGPWAVGLFFGQEFRLGNADMAYFAAASGAFMIALALGQALIAVTGYRRAALGWTLGIVTLFAVTAIPGEVLFRVERGFLAGALTAAAAMGALLADRLRRGGDVDEVEYRAALPTEA